MKKVITEENIREYLQKYFDEYKEDLQMFGYHAANVQVKLAQLMSYAKMAEELLGVPVHIGNEGKVLINYH